MHLWFMHLFEERMNSSGWLHCFECGHPMHEDNYKDNSCCYSHILSKTWYPDFAGDPDNVVIVHPDCHNIYTMRPKKAVNQYNKYLQLKEEYGL